LFFRFACHVPIGSLPRSAQKRLARTKISRKIFKLRLARWKLRFLLPGYHIPLNQGLFS